MRPSFLVLDVFTDQAFGGNRLAVLPDARDLDDVAMQHVAAEFGFPETTFVLAPDNPCHHAKVRIFTPRAEIPFAGHPTVGTALALAWLGRIGEDELLLLEEAAGLIAVQLEWRDGAATRAVFTAPQRPRAGAHAEPAQVAAALGLEVADIVADRGLPREWSCGLPFLLVELASREALAAAALGADPGPLSPVAADGVYLFTRDGGDASGGLRARMFAPKHAIPEDPATGSAAAALAGYLAGLPEVADGWHERAIVQGVEMGRPSLIETRALRADGEVVEVQVGGAAVKIAEGELEAPE